VVKVSDQNFDFDFLARETLALTEQLRKESLKKAGDDSDRAYFHNDSLLNKSEQFELELFEEAFNFSHSERENNREVEQENLPEPQVEAQPEKVQELPSGPGVVYKLEKGISTFCLRGIATSDMEWEREALERMDPKVMKALRITDSEDEISDELGFFATQDEAFAETIIDELINRRFPRQEASVCNLSDPGFSWWLSCENMSFEVYFQSHGIERDENLIQLGPLGDPFIAYQFFKKSFSFLKSQFSINEFSATQKGFRVSCGQSSADKFQELIQLFIDGNFPWGESVFKDKNSPDKELLLYFYEISLLRKFWIGVQDQLNH